MYVNYHESKELHEDYNISFSIKYYPEYNIDIFCMVTKENPHINIYYGKGMWSATKCARLSLLEPKYLYPTDNDIPNWVLSEDEKCNIINIFKSPNPTTFFINITNTVWDLIVHWYNFEFYCNFGKEEFLPKDLPMPDYTLL